jgi:proline iminopeptidase
MMYPVIEPYDQGMLDVGEGHRIYWETCGNPRGKPAVLLHGGPGSGCTPGMRRLFDPSSYRIVLFDQRGSGRSLPYAGDPVVDLESNTTHHLVRDIEQLRQHLAVERWLVWGGSWGTTLALAYAQRFPERASEMVLISVGTTTHREVQWLTRGAGRYFPVEWRRFRDGVPESERDGDLVAAYARLLNDPNPTVREKAASDWCRWEDTHVRVGPDHRPNPRYDDPRFRLAFARLVSHYWQHDAWLDDGVLIRNARVLEGIPGVLIHGRIDLSSPPDIAWEISVNWPGSELVIVEGAGHGGRDASMNEAAIEATNRFARRR